jgi:glycosyltransferase involved in cell wall biosynthesis
MRGLVREGVEIHAACVTDRGGAPTPTFEVLAAIPGVRLKRTSLGPEIAHRTRWGKALGLLATVPAMFHLVGLAHYIRRNRIRILHTSDRPRDALACVLLARLTGAKSIIHVHVGFGTWMSPILRWSLRHVDALVAVSEFVAATLRESGHPSHRIHVVLNAIDVDQWTPRASRPAARLELGLAESGPVVITVCRLFAWKGPAELLRAIEIVRREFPDVRLLVVGRDPEEDQSYLTTLRNLVDELALGDNVIFTGQRSDVDRLMAASDIFAMPSSFEPFGLVFAEAMAMQLPVVALNNGGTIEVVAHDQSGLLSQPDDIEALARNILALIRDGDLRSRLGSCGRRRVEERFHAKRMAHDTAQLYERLLNERG